MDPRLASSRLHDDVDRLQAQAALSWPREQAALEALGLRDGMSIVELGSGPGFITEALLTALPNAWITAVELDPRMCAVARDRLPPHVADRVDIVEASALFTGLPDDAFDFVLGRLLFQHLAAPELCASECWRLLRPGGRVAVIDSDDDLGGVVRPRLAVMDALAQRVRQIQALHSGDRHVGRKLWRLLADAGFHDVDLGVIAYHSDELGLEAFLPQYEPERYRRLVAPGLVTADEWASYARAYDEFVAAPEAYILQLLLLASGRKPPALDVATIGR
ncbi:MAG TPA: methyltransferase domain-containing protein [Chloroflexota bacterium]|nr:methyltransferase domain-containing protein [Chloroflexota bacterium]